MELNILIVEDNPAVRASLRDWLQSSFTQANITDAGSAEEALPAVQTACPTLVLMDISLPGKSGFEAARLVKALSPETLVVMISIHEAGQYQADAVRAGANGYVFKRRMHAELMPVLERLLEGREGKPNRVQPAQTSAAPDDKGAQP